MQIVIVKKPKVHSARFALESLLQQESELKSLLHKGEVIKAKDAANGVLRRAKSMGVYEVAITACSIFCKYYELFAHNRQLAKYFRDQKREFSQLLDEQESVREFFLDIRSSFDRNRTITSSILEKSRRYTTEARKYEQKRKKFKQNHPLFYHNYYYMLCTDRNINRDFLGQLEVAKEAFSYFEEQFLECRISKFYFLTRQFEAYFALKKWSECERILEIQDMYEIPRRTTYRQYLIHKCRFNLLKEESISELLPSDKSGYKDQDQMFRLIEIYHDLLNNKPVNDWGALTKYQKDPSGLGVSYNVARLWSMVIQGQRLDFEDRILQFIKRHLSNQPRSKIILLHLLYKDQNYNDFNNCQWDPDKEVIPFEHIYKWVERNSIYYS